MLATDPRTIGWFTRALTHEMGAVQHYLAQSILARCWGDLSLEKKLKASAHEELKHAEVLMEHLMILGVSPAVGQIQTVRLGRNIEELRLINKSLEKEAVYLYQQAVMHAQRLRDTQSAHIFQFLLTEEMEHLESSKDNHG